MRSQLVKLVLGPIFVLVACTGCSGNHRAVKAVCPIPNQCATSGTADVTGNGSSGSNLTSGYASNVSNAHDSINNNSSASSGLIVITGSVIPSDAHNCAFNPDYALPPRSYGTISPQCGQGFIDTVNFAYLNAANRCIDSSGHDNGPRPCTEPVHSAPDFRSPLVPGFSPLEGRDQLIVDCQGVGNNQSSSGTLQDDRGWRSNIWDKVRSGQLSGWINDLWLGDIGWRGIPC